MTARNQETFLPVKESSVSVALALLIPDLGPLSGFVVRRHFLVYLTLLPFVSGDSDASDSLIPRCCYKKTPPPRPLPSYPQSLISHAIPSSFLLTFCLDLVLPPLRLVVARCLHQALHLPLNHPQSISKDVPPESCSAMSETSIHTLAKALEQDKKREQDHKHKWALGEDTFDQSRKRPLKQRNQVRYASAMPFPLLYPHSRKLLEADRGPIGSSISHALRREPQYQHDKSAQTYGKINRKHECRCDRECVMSDSWTSDHSTAPVPDAGYTYSFDAACGPGKGSQILGQALARAVDNYETKATAKLVKDEYELVDREKEEDTSSGHTANEDDFELI